MKTHFWSNRDGYAYCGACVPTSQLTAHRSSITCKLCQRYIDGGKRKPGGEKRRPTGVKRGPKPGTVRKGDDLVTASLRTVLFPNDAHKPSDKAVDTLLRKAFVETEAQFVTLCDRARAALKTWDDADRDDLASAGENMADVLRGFLRAFGRTE